MMGHTRSRLFFLVILLIVTGVVASTAIRIEWYNHAVGGFLPRPQPPSMEGNEIKWRVGVPDWAEQSYRRGLAYERGLELTDEQLAAMPVTSDEKKEIDLLRRRTILNAEFRALVSSMGILQYPFVALALALSALSMRIRYRSVWFIGGVCLMFNLAACILMFYRKYYPSLGW